MSCLSQLDCLLTMPIFSSFADLSLRPCRSCIGAAADGRRMGRIWRRPYSQRMPGRAPREDLYLEALSDVSHSL
jgi:hypothetical protein